jgi:hypothetical protein
MPKKPVRNFTFFLIKLTSSYDLLKLLKFLVENVKSNPLIAATALRCHGLETLFLDMISSGSELLSEPSEILSELPKELETEDVSLRHIIGMPHHPALDGTKLPKWCHVDAVEMSKIRKHVFAAVKRMVNVFFLKIGNCALLC